MTIRSGHLHGKARLKRRFIKILQESFRFSIKTYGAHKNGNLQTFECYSTSLFKLTEGSKIASSPCCRACYEQQKQKTFLRRIESTLIRSIHESLRSIFILYHQKRYHFQNSVVRSNRAVVPVRYPNKPRLCASRQHFRPEAGIILVLFLCSQVPIHCPPSGHRNQESPLM